VRIEVGHGLEGALPDATANRIIDETILPAFRRGDVYGGISTGVDRMLRVIEGEALPEPELNPPSAGVPAVPVPAVPGDFRADRGPDPATLFGRVGGALARAG
jgi:uncharacterized protein